MNLIDRPRLFGIDFSNRDFNNKETWGKNQFNSSFPASLGCYMHSKGLNLKYIVMDETFKNQVIEKPVSEVYNTDPLSSDTFYAFETQYTPYQKYYIGSLPRIDLVVQNKNGDCLSGIEIKLTALPDQTTFNLAEDKYGSEIVVRPDTIVYLACSILDMFSDDLQYLYSLLAPIELRIEEWTNAKNIIPYIADICDFFKKLVELKKDKQNPILIQPVWKTLGKSPRLSNNCLDMFVWSDLGMLGLFTPKSPDELTNINRHTRTMIWLFKMLLDGSKNGQFDGGKIIDELSYNTKNDKAFATSGMISHKIMSCSELAKPRILKSEIRNIILGGGQNLLSPERRFDAIISNSPDLFDEEV